MFKVILFTLLAFCSFARANSKDEIASLVQGVKEHIDQKMSEAVVHLTPFPHVVVRDILPAHLYHKMQLYWPSSNEFVGKTRRILPITQGCVEQTSLPTDQKVFWRCFGEIVMNRYIKPSLIEKLSPFVSQKYKMPSCYMLNPLRDFTNYRIDMLAEDQDYTIPAHVDQLNVFAACLLYMPKDEMHSHYGTEFCEAGPCNDPNKIYIEKGSYLPTVKKIPYTPNTLVCFLQTPVAWHQVRANNDKCYVRKMIIAPINFSAEFMEKAYQGIYSRSATDDYYWDHKYLCRKNWDNPWGDSRDHYK